MGAGLNSILRELMLFNVNQAALATISSLFFCILIYFTAQSLAFTHLIGVIAGVASVFTVIYGRGALIGILLGTLIYFFISSSKIKYRDKSQRGFCPYFRLDLAILQMLLKDSWWFFCFSLV